VKTKTIPPTLPKPCRLPLYFLKNGDWFKVEEYYVGFVVNNPGHPLDIQVQLVKHHGKECDLRPEPWSCETPVVRIKTPTAHETIEQVQKKEIQKKIEKPKVDRIGCKIKAGLKASKINRAIGDDARTAEEIEKDSGVDLKHVIAHCNYHIKQGQKEGYKHPYRMVLKDGRYKIVKVKK
jgi:hypothetical protein